MVLSCNFHAFDAELGSEMPKTPIGSLTVGCTENDLSGIGGYMIFIAILIVHGRFFPKCNT